MYGYGVGYAVASLSCTVAPFLAVISTTFKQGSVLSGVLAFVAYAVGMTLTVGVAALTVALAGSSATAAFRRILPFVGRIAGVIVLITGLYVAYYGYYEIRLYFTRAETDDPVIQAASTLQDSLIRLVDGLSPWLLLGVAAALVAVAVGWHTLRDGAPAIPPRNRCPTQRHSRQASPRNIDETTARPLVAQSINRSCHQLRRDTEMASRSARATVAVLAAPNATGAMAGPSVSANRPRSNAILPWLRTATSSAHISRRSATTFAAAANSGSRGRLDASARSAMSKSWWRLARCAYSCASTAASCGSSRRPSAPLVTTMTEFGRPVTQ